VTAEAAGHGEHDVRVVGILPVAEQRNRGMICPDRQ
jgi:hypothetical protein